MIVLFSYAGNSRLADSCNTDSSNSYRIGIRLDTPVAGNITKLMDSMIEHRP